MGCGRDDVRKAGLLPDTAEATALLVRWRSGDRAAGDLLVEAFRPFLEVNARSQRRGHLQRQDLIQEGRLALTMALRRYDATTMSAPLPAYVASWIRARMKRYVMDYLGPVRPTEDADRAAFYASPELRPMAVELPDDIALVPEADPDLGLEADRRGIIDRCLAALSPREREVVVRTNLCEEPVTLAEIARESGLARQTIHGLDKRAMGKMRSMLIDVIGVNLECLV